MGHVTLWGVPLGNQLTLHYYLLSSLLAIFSLCLKTIKQAISKLLAIFIKKTQYISRGSVPSMPRLIL